jgi:hypothetical protein
MSTARFAIAALETGVADLAHIAHSTGANGCDGFVRAGARARTQRHRGSLTDDAGAWSSTRAARVSPGTRDRCPDEGGADVS